MTSLYWSLIRRYLMGKKGRSLITFLGIALGVTMVVAVSLTNGAIIASYESLLDGVAGRADLQITPSAGQGFPASFLDEAATAPGVAVAVPAVSSGSPVVAAQRKGTAAFFGIDPARDGLVRDYRFHQGALPASSSQIAITDDLAKGLDVTVGDKIQLLSTRGLVDFTITGIFDARGTARGALGPFGVLPLGEAQRIFGKEGKLDTIDILVQDKGNKGSRETANQALSDRFAGRARVGSPRERSRDMQKLLDSVVFSMTMAGSISLFAGAFIIYTNVAMSVAERRRDLAILRALGMRRGEVIRLVLAEAGALGLLGAGLGLAWGYGLSSAMAQQLTAQFLAAYGIQAARVIVRPEDAAIALAVGVGAALFAAYGPARAAATVSPVEAMRGDARNGADRHGAARVVTGLTLIGLMIGIIWATWPETGMLPAWLLRTWGSLLVFGLVGAILLLPAILRLLNRFVLGPLGQLLLGITGRLAADNLVREPRRTAATVCALMVSLTFMVGIGGMGASQRATFDEWYRKVIAWDLNVSTSFAGLAAQVEMDPAFMLQLAEIPGVTLVSPQKMGRVILSDGEQAFIQVFDHKLLRQYSETIMEAGDWPAAADAMEKGGAVIISPAVARRMNVGVGGALRMPTPQGEQTFRVVGVFKDLTPFGGTVQMDRQDFVKYWQDDTVTNAAVLVADQAQVEAVRQEMLRRWGTSMNLMVRSNQDFWAEIKGQYDAFYKLMDGLNVIAILVAGLALANTLFAGILERKREFGILRAIGTRRGEVVRVVVGEAFSTGLVGGAIGVAAGLALQTLFVTSAQFINGTGVDWVVPWGPLGAATAVALFFAPLVGILPARWAARLDVVDALRYE